MDLRATFVNTVLGQFAQVNPRYSAPHRTIYRVARWFKLRARINGIGEERWCADEQALENDAVLNTERLVVQLYEHKGKPVLVTTITFKWPACCILEVVENRRRRQKRYELAWGGIS